MHPAGHGSQSRTSAWERIPPTPGGCGGEAPQSLGCGAHSTDRRRRSGRQRGRHPPPPGDGEPGSTHLTDCRGTQPAAAGGGSSQPSAAPYARCPRERSRHRRQHRPPPRSALPTHLGGDAGEHAAPRSLPAPQGRSPPSPASLPRRTAPLLRAARLARPGERRGRPRRGGQRRSPARGGAAKPAPPGANPPPALALRELAPVVPRGRSRDAGLGARSPRP